MASLAICREGGAGGMIFPIPGSPENSWPDALRGVLYAVAMVYWFLGVAIVADIFMGSIEKVTSRRTKVAGPNGKQVTVKVWNETVATLTLMALGSSAPEIFLSVIDIAKKDFHFGTLGPSTIVGSAAFNLLVIIAVCIVVIPSEEVRIISNLPAFYITALFSMVAYIWMALILSVSTPEIVDLWEALVTFMLLPLMVYVSFKTDRGDYNWALQKCGVISQDVEVVVNEVEPAGYLAFGVENLLVPGSSAQSNVEVTVLRRQVRGELEPVSCSFRTESVTAVPGVDFEELEGTVEFEEGEKEKRLTLTIPAKERRVVNSDFLLILEEPEGGAVFDPNDDGGADEAIMTVTVEHHGPKASALQQGVHHLVSIDVWRLGMTEWREQVVGALYCHGSAEEQKEATAFDWVMHLLCLPWKLGFGLTMPPTSLMSGWFCFGGSLGGIALLTACVSDFAELFGCVCDIPDIVTATTFVALGTSMPDLFASLSAAKEDPTADASIVNVTGSNSVNVFLGLGVPWTVASFYWAVNGRTDDWALRYPEVAQRISGSAFVVEAKNLGFSVGAFVYICVLALVLLHFRRKLCHAELGGPFVPKVSSCLCLIFYWLAWVAIVSWKVLRNGEESTAEALTVIVGCAVLTMCISLGNIGVMRSFGKIVPISQDGTVEPQAEGNGNTRWSDEFAADTGGTGSGANSEAAAQDTDPPCNDLKQPARERGREEPPEELWDDDLGQEKPREPTGKAFVQGVAVERSCV